METNEISIDGWMDKENVVYTYSGIFFILKKEGNSAICYKVDKPEEHYTKWNKPVTEGK